MVELSPFRLYYPNSSATGGVLVGQTPPLKHQRLPPYSSTNISLPMTISFPGRRHRLGHGRRCRAAAVHDIGSVRDRVK